MADAINPRELVLTILLDIDKNKSYSHLAVSAVLGQYQYLDKQARAFITRMAEGTVEYQLTIDYIIDQFSKTKTAKLKPVIRNVLRMSVYQIRYMDSIPESAVCNEAVKLTKQRGLKALAGFVNGVLRNLIRNQDQIIYPSQQDQPIAYLSIRYSMPEWIISKWLHIYSYETVETMLQAFVSDRKTSIRVNESRIGREELVHKLEAEGVMVETGHYLASALLISKYNYLARLTSFEEGDFAIQDESSMLAAVCAAPQEGDRVLDVCAAPGGKSFHCADLLHGTGTVVSRDLTEDKVERLKENLERLPYTNVTIEQQDALLLVEKDLGNYDVVLADLPCSGLGIMAKKNDIKYKIKEQQQKELAKLQRDILHVVSQYVKPGGVLLYSTCTINKEENEDNANWFAHNYPFKLDSLDPYLPEILHGETTEEGYLQLLPGIQECDGFFIARFRREQESWNE